VTASEPATIRRVTGWAYSGVSQRPVSSTARVPILTAANTPIGTASSDRTGAVPATHPGRVTPPGIEGERSTASQSDRPSRRCRTITVATTAGGIDRRPIAANRSANSSSGNS
jgi:hypothetical protein